MKKSLINIIFMAALWVAMSFIVPPDSGKLVVSFRHYVGERVMQFDTMNYKNEFGQSFTVTKFKYYIGKVHLVKTDGTEVPFGDYYLVNEEEEASKTIAMNNIPAGQYAGISFLVGVDSADNCSGAQAGALDPVNAMFWAWNTGYIFLKLEGKSPASNSPGRVFEYHIGGYKAPANCIRRISLKFRQPLNITGSSAHELDIKADAAELLKTPTAIDFSKLSSVTDFHHATTIADNYMDMFSVLSVQ